jgi:hypothetical protein
MYAWKLGAFPMRCLLSFVSNCFSMIASPERSGGRRMAMKGVGITRLLLSTTNRSVLRMCSASRWLWVDRRNVFNGNFRTPRASLA